MVRDPRLASVYIGLNTVGHETASALLSGVGLKTLAEKYSGLLAQYASALAISNGHVAVPGGPAAEPIWAKLAGAAPAQPAQFLQVLLDRDKGRVLAFYSTLAQLDSAHQRFFTRTQSRTSHFYELFAAQAEAGAGMEKLQRFNPLISFLQDIPLDSGGSVDFPGSPEVWMVAKGQSTNAERTAKLMKKLKKAAAPDVEDEILIRLAKTVYKTSGIHHSELDNFLAVVRIDAHRKDPLDEAGALDLAQHFVEYQTFYPYFSLYTTLADREVARFFAMGERLHAMDEITRDLALGQIHGLLAVGSIARQSGAIDDKRAADFFYQVCDQFANSTTGADRALTALNLTRVLLDAAGMDRVKDPDGSVAAMLLGGSWPGRFQMKGRTFEVDAVRKRQEEYSRVLEVQKIPKLATLFRLQEAALALAAQTGVAADHLKILDSERGDIPEVEVPKNAFQGFGKEKSVFAAYRAEKLAQLTGQFRQKLSKKKVNRKDLEKIAHEFIADLNGQVTLALAGIVYAYYLHPDDLVVSEDPLLVRKHQFFELAQSGFKPGTTYPGAELRAKSDRLGSYFLGGFADFAVAAGSAARVGLNANGPTQWATAAQMASLRSTQWRHLREEDTVLLGLRLRVAREWITEAAFQPRLRDTLAEDTLGLISLTRRNDLLNAVAARDWRTAAGAVSLGDLFYLSERYMARYSDDPWQSPATAAFRAMVQRNNGERLEWLGPVMPALLDCIHPHLFRLAPYEDYERYVFPTKLAERSAELKLYLAALADREAIPPEALGALAETAAVQTLRKLKMADVRDWRSIVAAYSAMDAGVFEEAAAAK